MLLLVQDPQLLLLLLLLLPEAVAGTGVEETPFDEGGTDPWRLLGNIHVIVHTTAPTTAKKNTSCTHWAVKIRSCGVDWGRWLGVGC